MTTISFIAGKEKTTENVLKQWEHFLPSAENKTEKVKTLKILKVVHFSGLLH